MDDKLTTKTTKFTSLENLYVYGIMEWAVVLFYCAIVLSYDHVQVYKPAQRL